jgi:hypothetical protein
MRKLNNLVMLFFMIQILHCYSKEGNIPKPRVEIIDFDEPDLKEFDSPNVIENQNSIEVFVQGIDNMIREALSFSIYSTNLLETQFRIPHPYNIIAFIIIFYLATKILVKILSKMCAFVFCCKRKSAVLYALSVIIVLEFKN